MIPSDEIKKLVQEKYGEIAMMMSVEDVKEKSGGCGGDCDCDGECDGDCDCGDECACKSEDKPKKEHQDHHYAEHHHEHHHDHHHGHSHGESGCGCGSGCGCHDEADYNVMTPGYAGKEGYIPEADMGLGCGIPTDFADLSEGHIVLDLGSGAGNDAFIASKIVGGKGKVVGLDLTQEMIVKANANKRKHGINNVEFIAGDIESMPLEDHSFDVVLSNCVLNLVPDKRKAFSEIHRVLKTGGTFCVSDIVIDGGELPDNIKSIADFYTGCISGASQLSDYIKIIKDSGFNELDIHHKREVEIADDVLMNYLSREDVEKFIKSPVSIYSVTISARK